MGRQGGTKGVDPVPHYDFRLLKRLGEVKKKHTEERKAGRARKSVEGREEAPAIQSVAQLV